MVNLVNQEDS